MTASLSSQLSTVPLPAGTAVAPSLIDACEIASLFPGASCVVSEDGRLLAASGAGDVLARAIAAEVQEAAPGPILNLVKQTTTFKRPIGAKISLPREDDPAGGLRVFDVALLPCRREADGPRTVLIVAFESTLDHNLRNALISSRELFRELVRCSSDFAWETDAHGVFTFVGGRGAMGYSADALHGRLATSLVDIERSPTLAGSNVLVPFIAQSRVEDFEVWLRGAGGEAHCFLISAVPVRDDEGQWRGARGVGHDVTALRLREEELTRSRAREALSRAILDAMLSERSCGEMLGVAARALAMTTKSDRSWVLCTEEGGTYDVGAAFGMIPHGARHFLPPPLALPVLKGEGLTAFEAEGWHYLGAPTILRGTVNGGICVARAPGSAPFDEETSALVRLVASHAAVAITQANQLRALVDLVSSDELTGLANRRAFHERYERWLTGTTGPAARGAVLYIDLDDFKAVNDLAGHAAGDALLRTFASLMRRDSRKRDLPIRLGGDEFALFLEGIAPELVEQRALRLLKAASDIPLPQEVGGGYLKMSVGIATMRASDRETAEAVLERADAALYCAKRDGKGRIAIGGRTTLVEERTSC